MLWQYLSGRSHQLAIRGVDVFMHVTDHIFMTPPPGVLNNRFLIVRSLWMILKVLKYVQYWVLIMEMCQVFVSYWYVNDVGKAGTFLICVSIGGGCTQGGFTRVVPCKCGHALCPYVCVGDGKYASHIKGEVIIYQQSGHKCFFLISQCLKLPSLFAAWLFWTFHNKSHNMKGLVILSHLWSPFLPFICLYGKITFVRLCAAFVRKTSPRLPMQIIWSVGRFDHGMITVRQKKMWT